MEEINNSKLKEVNKKRIYITIDTEMDANLHWKKAWPPEYTSIYDGVVNFYRPLWDKYDAHPVYFLSPEILYDDECVRIFKKEVEKGAIIGAHLHPEYIEPDMHPEEGRQKKASEFPCSAYSTEIEQRKIENLTLLIEEKIGVRPVWYRAARFGADEDTYRILDGLGYKYDSSATPGISWADRGGIDYRNTSRYMYSIEGTGLTEMPVTLGGKRCGIFGKLLPDNWLFYKWLRPTHMTYLGMKLFLKEIMKKNKDSIDNGGDGSELVMMFHSMEIMIKKTPYVRWKWMQNYYLWRLEKIMKYAKKVGYEL